jgi:DNA-binding XRE family transcriptional regulator
MQGLDRSLSAKPPYEMPEVVDMEVMEVGPGQSSDNPRFGRFLADLREHAGLSRADAATTLGVSAEYLRLIELGRRTPALGQMRSFLDVYGADGEVGKLQPGGDRPDLIALDPLSGDPVVVEFKSRIREARGSKQHSQRSLVSRQGDPDSPKLAHDGPSMDRAADLGFVVSLLACADDSTIRKVRELLQDEVDKN